MTIYILHGWDLSSEVKKKWYLFSQQFLSSGININLILLPGFDKPLKKVFFLNDYVEFVKNQLPKGKNIILGHSFGGQIAIRLAKKYPYAVSNLILMDNNGLKDKRLKKIIKRNVGLILAKIGKFFTKNEKIRKFFYQLLGERDYFQAPLLLKKTMTNVLADSIEKDLKDIKQPTLIIWGQFDTYTPLYFTKILKTNISQAFIKVIPQAYHNPYFTHPQECSLIIQNWLERQNL